MPTPNTVPKDTRSATPALPLWNDSMVLGGAGAESYTVPANVKWIIIEPTAAIWCDAAATAVVPTTEIANGTAAWRLSTPSQFVVDPGQVISMIREGGSSVTVSISGWDDHP